MQGTMLQDGGVQGAMYKSPKVLYMGVVVVVVGVKGPGQGRREHAAATGGNCKSKLAEIRLTVQQKVISANKKKLFVLCLKKTTPWG